jgi:hypothetical protein
MHTQQLLDLPERVTEARHFIFTVAVRCSYTTSASLLDFVLVWCSPLAISAGDILCRQEALCRGATAGHACLLAALVMA